jgi:hypothetical protein
MEVLPCPFGTARSFPTPLVDPQSYAQNISQLINALVLATKGLTTLMLQVSSLEWSPQQEKSK